MKILILQHNPGDTDLLQNELKHALGDFTAHVVNTKEHYEDAIREFEPNIILSDYSLPSFDWKEAFHLKQKMAPEIPFILISEAIGEEAAVELIKNGLTDYALKSKPDSLIPKIVRALNEAEESNEKRLERESLQKSIINLRGIFENTDVGFLFLNASYMVLAYNFICSHWAANVFGVELKENVNFMDLLIPERANDFSAFGLAVLNGTPITYETPYPKTDGSLMWFIVSGKPVIVNEKTQGICIAITDITAHKLAEEQLAFERNNLSSLINNTNDLMWSVDKDFKLITSNKAFTELMEEMCGKTLTKGSDVLIPSFNAAQLNRYHAFYIRAFSGETFTEIEYTAAPIERWSTISFYPIRSGNEIIGTACYSHDITESKKAENEIWQLNEHLEDRVLERTAELSDANKALEAFSYSVSHDLRTPVRAVISFTKIIQQEYGAKMDTELKELFGFISDSGKRMRSIIEDLLKLARFGKEKLKFVPVNMMQLVKGVWSNINRNMPHNAKLDLSELPIIYADMSMMEQVVINLLSNAVKYSSKSENPLVKIWCERTKENITFYFKDNGAGFDMDNYDRLFEAFQRLHDANEFEGTGVGLTLVKSIIEKHGGTIGAEGKINEGATFHFALPLG
jgi:PAS domain S-box-containing protein